MIQKKCLRCTRMYGYKKSHEELLTESGMARLKDRRENATV